MIKEILTVVLFGVLITISDGKLGLGIFGKKNTTSSNSSQNGGNQWLSDIGQTIGKGLANGVKEEMNFCNKTTHDQKITFGLCFVKDYSTTECPSCTNVPINIQFSKVNIIKIDLKEQTITTSLTLRTWWFDDRIYLNQSKNSTGFDVTKNMDKFWIPKLATNHLIHDSTTVNLMRLSNSRMMYKEVGIYETACLMNFEDFAFDNQTCSIEVSSIFP